MVEISPRLNPARVLKDLIFDEEGRWAVPVANRMKVVDSVVPPRNVIIKDDTLRESTNMPGVLNPSPVFAGKLGSRYAYWSPDFDLSLVLETAKAAIQTAVDIRLRTPVTRKLASILKPDAVVVATGGQPALPQIPGIDNQNVITAKELLGNNGRAGGKVVVIGGGFIGCEVAELLAEKGKQVSIVEVLGQLAENAMHPFLRKFLLQRLSKLGVKMYCGSTVTGINAKTVVIKPKSGEPFEEAADTVVLSLGCMGESGLKEELQREFTEVYAIGECSGEAGIPKAIADGARIGLYL